jgi:hypothetical protein
MTHFNTAPWFHVADWLVNETETPGEYKFLSWNIGGKWKQTDESDYMRYSVAFSPQANSSD